MAKARIDLDRLMMAMTRARLVLKRYREERMLAVKQYAGGHYSEEAVRRGPPLNLIKLYCRVVGSKLYAHAPKVMMGTFAKQNKAAVAAMEAWVNHRLPKMHFSDTVSRIVLDALFSIGIGKVALAAPTDAAAFNGGGVRVGEPFLDRVSLDDFVFDVHARDLNQAEFIGHRYRVPLEDLRRSTLYSPERLKLAATADPLFNREGDERANVLGRTTISGSDAEEYRDHVDLWEVYLPHAKRVVTIADEDSQAAFEGYDRRRPLRDQAWVGPPTGPYHILAFNLVPDNPMPSGPVLDLIDLHEALNKNLRKLIRQSERYKAVCFVAGGADEDGNRVMKADDGDIIRVDNPDLLNQTAFGGPAPDLTQFMMVLKDLFSWAAGNLDILGGLSPQAKTATQDEMLQQNSSGQVAEMQEVTVAFVQKVVQALCWYWWYHPTGVMETQKKLPGLPDAAIQRKVYPRGATQPNGVPMPLTRDAWFEDLDIQIDPYSVQHSTPGMKLQAIMQVVQTVIVPMQPLLQQQGIYFDVNSFLDHIARYQNLPDLADIVSIAEPPQTVGAPGQSATQQEPGKPAVTERTVTRVNRSERTEQGTTQALRMGLMGQNPGGAPGASKNGGQK